VHITWVVSTVFHTMADAELMCCVLLQWCSRGTWTDGDAVQDAVSSNSALPADDSLSAGLLATQQL